MSASKEIWASETRLAAGGFSPASPEADVPFNVAAEFARFRAMKSLRSKYTKLVAEHGGGRAAPPLAFDRWLARSALNRAIHGDAGDHEKETGGLISREPLLPTVEGTNPGLVSDLSRTYPRAAAAAIADSISASARLAAEKHAASFHKTGEKGPDTKKTKSLIRATKLAAKRATKSTDDSDPWIELERAAEALRDHAALTVASLKPLDPPMRVEKNTSRGGGVILLSALDADKALKPYMSLNKAHYDKLVELHARFGPKISADDIDSLIFCLLCRYEALKGVGSQCAVPGAAFDSVRKYLGHTVECFASPLNCRFERFFSAYPGLERAFGSLGSFFGNSVLDINEGSFEANPPFVPEVMNFMERRIERLLADDRKGPLSFLVIVPDWGGGSSTADSCSRSRFKRAEAYIGASDHVFADGAQHRVSERWRPSSWDTAIILLQNDKGREKWPMSSDELTAATKGAFTRAANGGEKTAKEDVYAWEARGSRKGGKQGKNVPVKRGDGRHNNKRKRFDE